MAINSVGVMKVDRDGGRLTATVEIHTDELGLFTLNIRSNTGELREVEADVFRMLKEFGSELAEMMGHTLTEEFSKE